MTATSPVTLPEFELMQKTALFGPDDVRALRLSHDVLRDQTDAILDVWYGFVGANPHLVASFSSPATGRPLPDYLAAVRRRFAAWILDTARAELDQAWLDQQHEIGLRHHRAKKNATDGAASTDLVAFRYLLPLAFTITHTLRPFLGKHPEAERMHAAWVKIVLLQVALWSRPYVIPGDY